MGFSFLFALAATLGFCILFHVPSKCIFPAAIIGGTGWFLYQFSIHYGFSTVAAAFISACAVALLGDLCSRLIKEAATVFVIPGILPLVPGSGLYYTMFYFIGGNTQKAADWGVETLLIAGAIALGLLVVASVIKIFVNVKRTAGKWFKEK